MKEKELNREERNKTVMETGALVMAEFYADWCPHCQKMMPIVKEFKELEKGKLEVVQINIEEESALADLYTVESIPTFILLRKGEALWRQSGEMNLDRLRKSGRGCRGLKLKNRSPRRNGFFIYVRIGLSDQFYATFDELA